MIHLLIVSDIRFYRDGLAEILDSKARVSVVGTTSNLAQTVEMIFHKNPDVVLVDLTMIDSMQVVTETMRLCPDSKIIVLAVPEDGNNIFTCAEAGIAGYVAREASLEDLLNAVHGAINGELYCPPKIAAKLMGKIKSIKNSQKYPENNEVSSKSLLSSLTQREKQIAKLVSGGCSNKQIATKLNIEVSTVKNHVHNILVKMGVDSRMQAASIYQRYSFIDIPSTLDLDTRL